MAFSKIKFASAGQPKILCISILVAVLVRKSYIYRQAEFIMSLKSLPLNMDIFTIYCTIYDRVDAQKYVILFV